MAPEALVDGVREIGRARAQAKARGRTRASAIVVRFAGGARAQLDPESARDRVWAEVLESLRDSRAPAYIEIDPETNYITSLLLPRDFTVLAIREAVGHDALEIELEISHALHYLRRGRPRFDEMHKQLERARLEKTHVLVTESLDSSAIVDVRPAPSARPRRRG